MKNKFQIESLPITPFVPLFALSDEALRQQGARRLIADAKPGYPCRVSLRDAEIGERIIALPYVHHDTTSPYRASGPIFVRQQAEQAHPAAGEIPTMLRHRLLSVRAYDEGAILIEAEVVAGDQLQSHIDKLFSDAKVAYLHLHNARPGCYNCRVTRAK